MASQFSSVTNTFREKIEKGLPTFTVEANPPRGYVTGALLRRLSSLRGRVDAISVTDCAISKVTMNGLFFAYQIQSTLGISCICHFTCRDKNSLALQSDLLGAYGMGIENFIAMRGDSIAAGPEKESKGVFHLTSPGLLKLATRLNRGKTESGQIIKSPPALFFGAVANPSVPNQRMEASRVAEKIQAGARFIFTQPVFDHRLMRSFMSYLEEYQVPKEFPLIMGLMPIKSYEQANFLNQNVPGLFVPAEVLMKFKKKDSFETGISICHKVIQDLKPHVAGIHLFPTGDFEILSEFSNQFIDSPKTLDPPSS